MSWRRDFDRMIRESEADLQLDPWAMAADVVREELARREAERALDAPLLEMSVSARVCLWTLVARGGVEVGSGDGQGKILDPLGFDLDWVAGFAELYATGWIIVVTWLVEEGEWPPQPKITVSREVDENRLWRLVKADLRRLASGRSDA